MTQLDITFAEEPWELAITAAQPGSSISAVELLTLTEQASEEQLDDALALLREKQITLDIASLPAALCTGEAAMRLRLEQQAVRDGSLFSSLEENDPLRLYLEELAMIPAAGDPDVLALELPQGNAQVRERLVNLLLSRAVELAEEYVGMGVLLLDLIQEASLGLWEGIGVYQTGDICRHCDWWVRQYLTAAVLRQARQSGTGERLARAMEDYRSVDEKLLIELGRNPTVEEIAEGLHISVQETQIVANMVANVRSLNFAKQPEPEELPQEEDQAVENTAYFQMRQRIQELLSGSSSEDAKLLTLRYGLEGGRPMDPSQVGMKLGLTAQQVIEREAAALAKLRQ